MYSQQTIQRELVLEASSAVCYDRAEMWCNKMTEASLNGGSEFAIFKARRDEADSCKVEIRKLMHLDIDDESKCIVILSSMLKRSLTMFSDQAYRISLELMMCRYEELTGLPFPFPVQPSTPPFDKGDDDEEPKVA